MRVLVVDDSSSNRLVLATLLKRAGHDVLAAGTIAEALRFVREERPSAILTDLNVPHSGEGIAFAREVRQMPFGRDMHLALMTGDVGELSTDDGLFDAVLNKPVLLQDLIGFLEGRGG